MKRLATGLAFALGVTAVVLLVWRLGFSSVGQAMAKVGVQGVLLLALAHLPTLGVLGLAWWSLARQTPGAGPLKFVWARLLRDAGAELLPFSQVGGYLMGVRAIGLVGGSGMRAAVTSLLDIIAEQIAKVPYMAASVALLLWLAPGSGLATPAVALLALSSAVVVLAVLRRRWVGWRIEAAVRSATRGSRMQTDADPVVDDALLSAGRAGLSFALHLGAWCLSAAETWLALRLLGTNLGFAQAVVIDGLFVAVRMFAFFVPAAAGVQEGAYIALGALFGAPAPTMVAFSFVRRARDLLVGAPAVIAWLALEGRSLAARGSRSPGGKGALLKTQRPHELPPVRPPADRF